VARYKARDYAARDILSSSTEPADLRVAALKTLLLPDGDPMRTSRR